MTQQQSRSALELSCLEKQHEAQRIKTLEALNALSDIRRHALLQLQKPQILFKYLNWKQQEHINSTNNGDFSLQRMYALSASVLNTAGFTAHSAVPVIAERTASYLQKVKTARKNIVQFGIIEARANELIQAIAKSAVVVKHQYKTACRELFPLGFISRIGRHIKRFFHHPFYTWQEIGCLANLGMAAGFVFKMAEAPIFGERR